MENLVQFINDLGLKDIRFDRPGSKYHILWKSFQAFRHFYNGEVIVVHRATDWIYFFEILPKSHHHSRRCSSKFLIIVHAEEYPRDPVSIGAAVWIACGLKL